MCATKQFQILINTPCYIKLIKLQNTQLKFNPVTLI